jgi:predicted acetyltransferase
MEEKVEIRGCKSSQELIEVVELCDKAFDNTPYEYFERHLLKDKTLSLNDTRILLVDNQIVSSVQVFPRVMYIKEEKVEFCGIGNVATHPKERKKGYAELVMKDAADYMLKGDTNFSLLTTSINKYYEKFGYKTLTRELYEINNIRSVFNPDVRVFDFDGDFEKIKNIYELYNQNSIGPIYRDEIYWQSQFNFSGEDPKLFLVIETNNNIKGYVRALIEKDKIKILEFAAVTDVDENFQTLMQSICNKTGINKFEIFLSLSEKQKLKTKDYTKKTDTDLMILFWDNDINENQVNELIKDNNITFWLSDFF